jgi:hypothetical protein
MRSKPVTPHPTKTEIRQTETDRAARAIIAEERARHVAKTAKLREIRLRREAAEADRGEARTR